MPIAPVRSLSPLRSILNYPRYIEYAGTISSYTGIPNFRLDGDRTFRFIVVPLFSSEDGDCNTIPFAWQCAYHTNIFFQVAVTAVSKRFWYMYRTGGPTHHFYLNTTWASGQVIVIHLVADTSDLITGWKLCVDGVLKREGSIEANMPAALGPIEFGYTPSCDVKGATNCRMSQFKEWNRALSIPEIAQDCNAVLAGHEGIDNEESYYPMDEGAGNTVSDARENNADGTIYGATWVSDRSRLLKQRTLAVVR